ncbi:MAG: amylo-alpha-1,6-glucosidase [Candidatus Kappaea frigidicola]|nr:amylo-alpha-1,6-glucosidase [Candidatus Kappaea frigidicola]
MDLSKLGKFSKDGTEFIMKEPVLPRPWINYLSNEDYCAVISQTAGGYSFYKDCRSDRILRWHPENFHFDRPGRYVCVHDKGKKKAFSLTYQPIRAKYQQFESRHGLGYTTITSKHDGLSSEVTYFVPEHDTCELWIIKMKNDTSKKKDLVVYPFVEWLVGDYHEELIYRNILNLYNRFSYEKDIKAIIAKKTACWQDMDIKPFEDEVFFASTLPIKGYSTRKDAFFGLSNTEESPEVIMKGEIIKDGLCSGEDGVGALIHEVSLKPKESKEFVVILGQTSSRAEVKKLLEKYRNVAKVKKELAQVKKVWRDRILDNVIIETPDMDFDLMMNIWVKYQLYICNFWSRSPSFFHEGSGGRGYRDSCQDAEGILSINAAHAKDKIETIAALIRKEGTAAPGWSSTMGPAGSRPNKDHPVWLTYTVASYVKETGDKKFLLKKFPYLKDKWIGGWVKDVKWHGGPKKDGSGTLFEHLERNLNFTFHDVGRKGLPLIGHADWNDGIDAAGKDLKGESVWLAMALVRSLKTLAELAMLIGKDAKAADFLKKAKIMTDRINKVAWDGDWYTRGYTDKGTVYGSKKNKEGKIYLNTQSWAILADMVNDDQKKKIFKSVDKYLDGKHGYALFSPAYSKYDPELGRITMFSEGTKENAAVFCHAATFMIAADLVSGRGNQAYKAMKKLMPNHQKDFSLYKTEPYTYSEYMVGPEHPYLYGEGAFTWITGTAGWSFMAGTEYLLGIKRDYDGLKIEPCLPSAWKKAKIRRPFRGAVYEVEILNPKGVQSGVKSITLDSKVVEGNVIKTQKSRKKPYKIKVVMG